MEASPFLPPELSHTTTESAGRSTYPEAKNGKRFLNNLIDVVIYYILVLVLGFVYGFILVSTGSTINELESMQLTLTIISLVFWLLYYTLMEAMFGLTIGKWATGTRVVDNYTHEKPTLPRALLRSVCRFIPFEPFSFFGNKPGGWHDTLSKTRTIDIREPPITIAEYEEARDILI